MNSLSMLFFAAMLSSSNASATDAQALAQSKGCLSCHAVNSQLVGPSYKAVAKLYAGKPDAENYLVQKLVKGGSGVWGQMPMPGGLVNEKEARVLAKWVLSIK